MLRYSIFPENDRRPLSRWLLVGSHIIILLVAVYIIDLRMGDPRQVESQPRVVQSSIVPVDLVMKEVTTVAKEPLAEPKSRPVRAYRPRGVFESIRPWMPYIRKYAGEYGVDPDLVGAILYVESKGDPYTVSPRGALGLMQITPSTAEHLGISDVLDPEENIRAGVKYLAWLIDKYDEPSALLAYNAGLGMVEENRIPRETKRFVEKVLSLRSFLRDNKKHNDLS